MARIEEKNKALDLRRKGMSYLQIKEAIGVSKSTLHYWLKDHPLSEERIRELRDNSPRRIERYRNTMALKREVKRSLAYDRAKKDIQKLSKRDIFIAGFFLYWAEGAKSDTGTVLLANTDPGMIRMFIVWLKMLDVPQEKLRVRLQLYSDMDCEAEVVFWMKELELPKSCFRNPTIKKSIADKRRNYKGRFGHGTCDLICHDQQLHHYLMMGIEYLKKQFV